MHNRINSRIPTRNKIIEQVPKFNTSIPSRSTGGEGDPQRSDDFGFCGGVFVFVTGEYKKSGINGNLNSHPYRWDIAKLISHHQPVVSQKDICRYLEFFNPYIFYVFKYGVKYCEGNQPTQQVFCVSEDELDLLPERLKLRIESLNQSNKGESKLFYCKSRILTNGFSNEYWLDEYLIGDTITQSKVIQIIKKHSNVIFSVNSIIQKPC